MVKVISLSERAYEDLKATKKGEESFSDAVIRLTSFAKKKSLMELAGQWVGSDEEWEKIELEIKDSRKSFKFRDVTF